MQSQLYEVVCYCNARTVLFAISFSIIFAPFLSLLILGLVWTFPISFTLINTNIKGILQGIRAYQRSVIGACLSGSVFGEYTERVKDKQNQNQRATWYSNCNLVLRGLVYLSFFVVSFENYISMLRLISYCTKAINN